MITLRPMEISDSDFMLELKNYEETREFAIQTHDEIKKEDHEKWLPKYMDQFQVICVRTIPGEVRVGVFRINGNEVSIWIHRGSRGSGIALKTLNQVSFKGMIARIVDGNIASFRTFCRAGFLPVRREDNYYILEKS